MPQYLFASECHCPIIGRYLCGTINTISTMMLFAVLSRENPVCRLQRCNVPPSSVDNGSVISSVTLAAMSSNTALRIEV
jgi:hypothetical protein